MQLIKARNRDDIVTCVNMYCDQETDELIETNKMVSINNLVAESRNGYYRVLVEFDSNNVEQIVGWILAYRVLNPFNGIMELQQQFYTSIFTGLKAVKAVKLVHEELIKYAETYRIPVVTSHCSHNDLNFVLCRILQKEGWQTRGYMAYWRTSWHPKPFGKLVAASAPRHAS